MNAKTIDIKNAVAYATKWQLENTRHAKAHLIPCEDLIACLEEMEILVSDAEGKYTLNMVKDSGIRAYMAINRPDGTEPSPETEKLLLVGTRIDGKGIHRDLVEGEQPSNCGEKDVDKAVEALKGSGVFDFTRPCPQMCDVHSPLYT